MNASPPDVGVRLPEAAKALGTSPESLRRWIREEGCPVLEGGGRGRGKGSRVDVDAVRAWRAAKAPVVEHEAELRQLSRLALDFFRRGREVGELGQRMLGIPDWKAAALLVFLLNYFAVRLIKDEFPTPEIALLVDLVRQGKNVHGMNDLV